jgi:uncharacterized protein YlxW (UPF0749 family)
MTPVGAAPPRQVRRNLIDQLTADAIASDYAWQTPQVPASNARRRRQRLLVAASSLALAGFVLAVGLSSRILNEPAVVEQRAALRERVAAATDNQEKLAAEVVKLRKKVETARSTALDISLLGVELAKQISALELQTGYAAAVGPGVTVTMTDAPDTQGDDVDPELTKVLDTDLQVAVNGLWQAGAEAIAINGQRLSARSAIRSAAGAVLVNYRPLAPPYVIEAIGGPDLLRDFSDGADAKTLKDVSRQFGIGFSAADSARLELPAATGRLPDTAQIATKDPSGQASGSAGVGVTEKGQRR